MKSTLLDIQELSCGYGAKRVLNRISLAVYQGEMMTVIGPNGSGKTTLLRAVAGILAPMRGGIHFSGEALHQLTRAALARKIAVVGQLREAVPMTVTEYVLLGRIPYYRRFQFVESKQDRDLAGRYMELTGVDACAHRRLNELSGGQMQLAAIARGLVQEPALLLLDEPTAHLDITHQTRILDLIQRLNRELDLTVMMVLHDLNLAGEYSHRLALLKEGTLAACGRPEEVLTAKTVQAVYDTAVVVDQNPLSGRPCLFLVTAAHRHRLPAQRDQHRSHHQSHHRSHQQSGETA